MENNDLNEQNIINKEESVVQHEPVSLPLNQNLTNEQKLEYLSKLIQKAEQNLESNGLNKKLIRKDNT